MQLGIDSAHFIRLYFSTGEGALGICHILVYWRKIPPVACRVLSKLSRYASKSNQWHGAQISSISDWFLYMLSRGKFLGVTRSSPNDQTMRISLVFGILAILLLRVVSANLVLTPKPGLAVPYQPHQKRRHDTWQSFLRLLENLVHYI